MKKTITLFLFIAISCLVGVIDTQAQIVGSDAFLKGLYVEVGASGNGAFGSTGNSPTGFHPRYGGGSAVGFVADPDMDGWSTGTPNYYGDFFLPGSPQEGWDVEATSSQRSLAWRGFGAGYTNYGSYTLTGSYTTYSVDGAEKSILWEGDFGPLEIRNKTVLDTNSLFFVTYVVIKNTGTTTVDSIYYNRTVDPDNEVMLSGGQFNTINQIIYQPGVVAGGGNKCLVIARGSTTSSIYGFGSYLGLGTVDCRAKSYIVNSGLMPNQYPHVTYGTGGGSYYVDVGDSLYSDVGIGVVFFIGSLAPGDSTKLAYAYILSASQLDSAFAKLSPTFNTSEGSFIDGDTVKACVGDTINVSIEGGDEFVWGDWTPPGKLTVPSGPNTGIIVADTPITYTIVGSTIICDDHDTMTITIEPYVVPDPGTDSFGQICSNADPVNLFLYLGGTPEPGGTWSGPGVTASGIFNPSGFSEGFYTFTYNTSVGPCFGEAHVVIQIINDVDIDFNYTVFPGCDEDTVVFENLSDSITYFRWNFGDGSPQDTVNFDPTHIYDAQGEYGVWLIATNTNGCTDSLLKLVNTEHPLEAQFTMSSDSICQNYMNTVTFTDASVGDIASWYWTFGDGGTSTLQNPTHTYTIAGKHEIMLVVTDNIPCSDTTYQTLYVDSTPSISVDINRDSICMGEMINIHVDYIPTATQLLWDFGDGSHYRGLTTEQSHSYTGLGNYYFKVTSQHAICPDAIAYDTVFVKPYPSLNLGADTQLCLQGAPIYIDASDLVTNPPNTVYYWSTGDTTAEIRITSPGTYDVTANLDGCITTDQIVVNKDCYIDIPNSFTPNGDGKNDYFFPRQLLSKGVVDFTMSIYNRWGQLIFETNNPEGRGWDGKFNDIEQPQGVYVYQISVRYKNMAAEKYTGNVTLLR